MLTVSVQAGPGFWGRLKVGAALAGGLLLSASGAALAEVPGCPDAKVPDAVFLQVEVTGIKSADGNITITVYPDDPKRFLAKGGKLARQRVPTALPTTRACFLLPAAGHYAVAVYHDADNDTDFGRNFVGLPAEGYGFSSNPKTLVGLPALAEVRVAVQAGDPPLPIRLSY